MRSKRELKSNLSLFSPAKLNLFFRVLSKRDDGYHEIASLMQAISLGDRLYFERSDRDELTSNDPSLPCDESNLVQRALTLFRQKTGISFPVKIFIEKSIPIEGGLGGGSSNLATTLWALNELSGSRASLSELREWAGIFTSDGPFFFSEGTAYCTGRGEKIKNLSPAPRKNLWLAKVDIGMSTPLVYSRCIPNACSNEDPQKLLEKGTYINDLEAPVFTLEPKLEKLKHDLLALGFEAATMTGSGSTFFCFGEVENPSLPGVHFIEAPFLTRSENDWYNSHECEKMASYGKQAL